MNFDSEKKELLNRVENLRLQLNEAEADYENSVDDEEEEDGEQCKDELKNNEASEEEKSKDWKFLPTPTPYEEPISIVNDYEQLSNKKWFEGSRSANYCLNESMRTQGKNHASFIRSK